MDGHHQKDDQSQSVDKDLVCVGPEYMQQHHHQTKADEHHGLVIDNNLWWPDCWIHVKQTTTQCSRPTTIHSSTTTFRWSIGTGLLSNILTHRQQQRRRRGPIQIKMQAPNPAAGMRPWMNGAHKRVPEYNMIDNHEWMNGWKHAIRMAVDIVHSCWMSGTLSFGFNSIRTCPFFHSLPHKNWPCCRESEELLEEVEDVERWHKHGWRVMIKSTISVEDNRALGPMADVVTARRCPSDDEDGGWPVSCTVRAGWRARDILTRNKAWVGRMDELFNVTTKDNERDHWCDINVTDNMSHAHHTCRPMDTTQTGQGNWRAYRRQANVIDVNSSQCR